MIKAIQNKNVILSLTLFLTLYTAYAMYSFFPLVQNPTQTQFEQIFMQNMHIIIPLHLLFSFFGFYLIAFFLSHLDQNSSLNSTQKLLWLMFLCFLCPISMFAYWFMYIKNQKGEISVF
jgi:hypothetical protein